MEETFQLPNEVSCSSHVQSKTANSKQDQTNITTSECKKVSTLNISSISRPSKITPDMIEGDKLAKQATALRRLKWISAFLAISTVINSATFGGLTHSLMERMENNERLSVPLWRKVLCQCTALCFAWSKTSKAGLLMTWLTSCTSLEDALMMRTSTNEAHISEDTSDIETRLLKVETIQAQDLVNAETRILNLESYQTQDRAEFQEISTTIDSLAANLDTAIVTSKENSEKLTKIESELMKLEPNETQSHVDIPEIHTRIEKVEADLDAHITAVQADSNMLTLMVTERNTLRNLSMIINDFKQGSNTEFVTVQEYTNETRNIWTKIETERAINEEHSTRLSQLRTDWDFVTSLVQDYSSRVTQVESDRTADRSSVEHLSTRVTQLEADLVSESAITETNSDMILDNRDSLIQLQADVIAQNTSIRIATNRLAQLTKDTTEDRTNLLLQDTRLIQVESNMATYNISFKTHGSRIEELESQDIINQDIISNHTARLHELETNLSETNVIIQVVNSINQAQTSRILELELEANKTINKFEDYGNSLTNATDTLQASIVWLQKKVGPGLSANSSLEEQITEMEATISVVLNNHTSRITQMEYSSGVAEDAIANHTYEIAEIEKNRQSDVAEIQAHYARILGLEQADNESNAVLEIHAATLRNLELQIGFSASGNTIDSSYKVIFNTLKSAYETGYSTSTGVFTCYQPGLYYFSSSLVKTRGSDPRVDQIICQLFINSNPLIYTRTDPTDTEVDVGSYETSIFHVTHLDVGDQVYVKCTTGTLEYYSIFSGFLIVSD